CTWTSRRNGTTRTASSVGEEEVLGMEDSATYQAIVRKSRVQEARHLLLLLGETKFGPADAPTRGALEAITDLPRLEELSVRLLNAGSWQELLALPTSGRRARRPKGEN